MIFEFERSIIGAQGTATFSVEAESREAALECVKNGTLETEITFEEYDLEYASVRDLKLKDIRVVE